MSIVLGIQESAAAALCEYETSEVNRSCQLPVFPKITECVWFLQGFLFCRKSWI